MFNVMPCNSSSHPGIYSHLASERLVVLLEDAKSPAASVTANRISADTIRQTMRDNQWLLLPRLSSQTVLDELCPVGPSSTDRRDDDDDAATAKTFCIVLVTRRDDDRGRRAVESFRKFARDFKQNHSHYQQHHFGGTPKIQFAYLFKSTQSAFFEALEKERKPPEEGGKSEVEEEGEPDSRTTVDVDPIALLWRHSAEGLRFGWAPRGWASLPPNVPVTPNPESHEDVAAFDAAAATAKRQRKKLVRQAQNSLSSFIAQMLATPSHELHHHLIAGAHGVLPFAFDVYDWFNFIYVASARGARVFCDGVVL